MTNQAKAKYPPASEAMHSMEGVLVGEHFRVISRGDTLKMRGVDWQVVHYPDGQDGDCHPAEEFSRYREALAVAKRGECADCGAEGLSNR